MATSEVKREAETQAVDGNEEARIGVPRYFTKEGVEPFDAVEWETRTALIPGKDGPSFEQNDVEFPTFWSQTATNIVAQKYFRGKLNTPQRERSVRQMIGRVADTITGWGIKDSYFVDSDEAETFRAELTHLLLHQMVAFNSPVWFNVGFEESPQCSACFILSVEDDMDSILDWIRKEGRIFRGGSGAGINLSKLRSSQSSWQRAATPPARSRSCAAPTPRPARSSRAARPAARPRWSCSNIDHPDIEEFIWCKQHEEEKARVLQSRRLRHGLDSPATGRRSSTRTPTTRCASPTTSCAPSRRRRGARRPHRRRGRRDVRGARPDDQIAEAAWSCADPGMQYDTTINDWHTCPNTGRINACNPCSEYMSSTTRPATSPPQPDEVPRRRRRVRRRVFEHGGATSSSWRRRSWSPTRATPPRDRRQRRRHRQLGLGYANLGAL